MLKLVGLSGLEPLTSRLSGVCSNHLSYRPSEDQQTKPPFLVTGQLKGVPIGLNLPNILGRKRNEAGARAKGPPDTMSGIYGADRSAGPCVPTSNREDITWVISIRVQP